MDSECLVCGEEEEDMEHYEFGCSKVEELRQTVEKQGEGNSAEKSGR